MTFSAPFSRVITRPFGGVPATSSAWWLAGGIAPANCIAAYQAKGAASLAESKVNLTGNATYNLTVPSGDSDPDFDTNIGWTFTAGNKDALYLGGVTSGADANQTLIIALKSLGTENSTVFGRAYNNSTRIRVTDAKWTIFHIGNKGVAQSPANYSQIRVLAISGNYGYVDGVKTAEQSPTTFENKTIYLMKGAGIYKSGIVTACAKYNTALTSTQIGLLTTAMKAL